MGDQCPHLAYRSGDGELAFDHERPFCTVAGRFVQPVRADVCNARYELSPADHCEIYREHEGIEDPWIAGDRPEDDGGSITATAGSDDEDREAAGEDER